MKDYTDRTIVEAILDWLATQFAAKTPTLYPEHGFRWFGKSGLETASRQPGHHRVFSAYYSDRVSPLEDASWNQPKLIERQITVACIGRVPGHDFVLASKIAASDQDDLIETIFSNPTSDWPNASNGQMVFIDSDGGEMVMQELENEAGYMWTMGLVVRYTRNRS